MAEPVIPTPLTSGATDQGGPGGIPPSPQPQPAAAQPASDAQMIAQGAQVTSHGMPAVIPGSTPTPTQASTVAQSGQPTTAQPAQPTPQSLHSKLYDSILRTLAPPTRYIDAQGNPQQTRPSLSHSILSGVVAGMLTPTSYREGSFGPIADTQATAANAFKGGQEQAQKQMDAVQKQVEDIKAAKLSAAKTNADTMHLYAATALEQGTMAQQQVDNFAPTLKIATDHDQNLQPGDQKAVLASGMTMADALKHPEFRDAMLKHTLVPDGVMDVDDGQGHMIPTQTFSVIDPNVKVSMNKDAIDIASQINPQWKAAFEGSGGSMKMRLGQIQTATNQVNSVQYAENIFQQASDSDDKFIKSLGLKGDIKGEIMSAVRQGTPGSAQALQALMAMENAKASGGSGVLDSLDRLIHDPEHRAGVANILTALGTTSDKVAKYVQDARNEQVRLAEVARQGGIGEKAPATPAQLEAYENSRQGLPADQVGDFMKPPEGGWTQGQLEKEQQRVDTQKHDNIVSSQAAADPDAIASLVGLTIGAGDLTGGKDLFTGNRAVKGRIAYDLASAKTASDIGLNPIHYTAAAMKAKQEKFDEYTSTKNGSVGAQLNSYNTFLTHNADAVEASDEWKRTNSPLLNRPLSWLAVNAADDPEYIKFKASLLAPDKEFMNFLNAGHAETVEDAKAVADITNANSTPKQILAAFQQLAKTADDRAATIGDSYVGVVGTTYPNLINANSRQVLKTLGVPSRAVAFNGELPRNPNFVAHPSAATLNPITDPTVARRFLAAAGGDTARAVGMAREHGWIVNP